MAAILSVEKLTKYFPPVQKGGLPFVAVDRVSFEVEKGHIVGLLGPNGAGKSTTIFMLLGVLAPSAGTITYFGKEYEKHRSTIMHDVTFASTYIKMPWRLTVLENLSVYATMYGLTKQTFLRRAEKFMTRFGVWDQKDKPMNELSAGQTTRVMLVKAFIPHPKVVLLDEPTASLDPDIAREVRFFVKNQQREFGTTMLYTSHNMEEISEVCDSVLFLKNGKIIARDTPENLASTISRTRMRLMVKDGLKRIDRLAGEQGLFAVIDGREIEIHLEERTIAQFLNLLAGHNIEYTQISIAKPTLEDYFLKMTSND